MKVKQRCTLKEKKIENENTNYIIMPILQKIKVLEYIYA